ncbi:MAG TPA: selenocysteine-specific translation elongation factor [Nocardioidaceae bacterium]|nr:selenocysteine-specific translation elongation factor [Nocardioidaceae bacterium]
MHVIATAGHVDHGKSTLVRALTGHDPDRLEEEHRRGLSIELGYVWTSLDPVGDVAFVDVPGHERFITTMLAGIGPVPAVLFVVAADDPWMPQAAEHLAALHALGVSHGVVAVSRADLADPAPVVARVEAEIADTSLRGAPIVPVSGHTGAGLDELRAHLVALVQSLPDPDRAADVRLWVDRRFTIKGAGTVVTGTLPVGTVRVGDTLAVGDRPLRVRGVQSLGRDTDSASGVARVALNLAGDDVGLVERGSALVTPGAWHHTDVMDVRLATGRGSTGLPPERPLLHVGATSVATHCRPLSDDLVRVRLERPLPLRVGDRALLRDPGSREVWGVTVLDPMPPPLRRRGAAAARAKALASVGAADLAGEVTRRGLVRVEDLRRIGVPVDDGPASAAVHADGWLMSEERADAASAAAETVVTEHNRSAPLDPGLPLSVLAERLGLPSPELARAVVRPPLRVESGRVTSVQAVVLPPALQRAVEAVRKDLERDPFAAPTADRLREVGLDNKGAAAAAKAGLLLRPAPGIVLLPDADRLAAERLAELPQPFTTSEARQRLGTSRRVVLPLLEHLDRNGLTRRLADDRREVTGG